MPKKTTKTPIKKAKNISKSNKNKASATQKKIETKKNVFASKKLTTKKSISKPKQSTSKQSPSKKSLTRTIPIKKTIVKKTTTTKAKKSVKKYNTSLDVLSMNREVIINNKKVTLPKNHNFVSYLCVWRMYLQTNPKTKQQYVKRFWIVIGEGHKNYRKFETQEEAIRYFRNLKKYAKMRVQSANSKRFTRTIYTFFELIFRGLDIKKINFKDKVSKKSSNKNVINENVDYEDEYTKYDLDAISDDTNPEESVNEEEIDKIISEKDGETVLLDYKLEIEDTSEYDPYDPYTKTVSVTKTPDINTNNKETTSEYDPYKPYTKTVSVAETSEINNDGLDDETETFESTTVYNNNNRLFVEEEKRKIVEPNLEYDEIVLFENPNNHFRNNNANETNGSDKTSLYDLVSKEEKDTINEILKDDYAEIEDEFKIEQHQTSTNKYNEVLNYNEADSKSNKNTKKKLWITIISLVVVALIVALVIIFLYAFKILK